MATQPVTCSITQGYNVNPQNYSQYGLKLRNGGHGHEGIDYGCRCGTEIKAAHAGMVRYAGVLSAYGNYVGIQADNGSGTGYGHLQEISVRVGQRVNEGQVIGKVGSTGNSTGCHLHFNYYRQYGVWVYDDPNELLASKGGDLPYDQAYVDGVVKNYSTAANKARRFLAASEYRVGGLEPPSNLDKFNDRDPDDIVKEIRGFPGYSKNRSDAQQVLDKIQGNLDS